MDPCSDIPDDPKQQRIAMAIDHAEEARDEQNRIGGPKCGTPPEILPIGHSNGTYFFISKDGERRQFSARELVRLNIASIFGGQTQWLCDNFPVYNKKGEVIKDAFNSNGAAEWLMRQCSQEGLYNPSTPMRRIGVWRDRTNVIAHFGGEIWHMRAKQKAGCIIAGAIYPACPSLPQPEFENPADSFDCKRIRQNMNAWSFTQQHDADLLFGFMGAALLGGFPKWRVHALITGEGGSGKSTLGRYITDAIGAQASTMSDYSEAGIRQSLADEARLVWLDEGENEGEEQSRRMAKVVSLLRKMSDGAGARIVRGSSGGTAVNTTVTGSVLITAINPPPLQPQDRSRILNVPIDKPSSGTSAEDIRAMRDEASTLSPRLRARALLNADRFDKTFDQFRKILLKHGCDDRRADFFGTMLAGRSLLIDDEIPSEDNMQLYVASMRDRLRLIMIDDSDTSDGQSCLNRLLDAECAAIRDGIKRSVGQLVASGMTPPQIPENEKLIPLGIRIIEVRSEGLLHRYLFVSNDSLGLKRIFHNSPWADGNWRGSLKRLPGVDVSPIPISVGRKSRGLLIPRGLLPTTDNDEEVDLPPPST